MFWRGEEAWTERQATMKCAVADIRSEITQIERKIEQVVERILAADSPALVAAYEKEVRKMEECRTDRPERMGEERAAALQDP